MSPIKILECDTFLRTFPKHQSVIILSLNSFEYLKPSLKIGKLITREDFLNVNIKSKNFVTLPGNPREE